MWMGIDVGTGGTRALLVDAQGRVAAGFTAAHEDIRMERPLWAEQRPENWWDAARAGHSRRAGRRPVFPAPRCAASVFPARCTAW